MGNSKSFGIAEYGNLKGVGIQFDYTCSTCGRAFPPKTLFQTVIYSLTIIIDKRTLL